MGVRLVRWNGLRPEGSVRPGDPNGVSRVIEVARESSLELAVRGGGHSSAGHGVTDGGIVLDLTRLKALKIDPERRVAWAQAGLTAGEFTAAAAEHGLGVSFGDTGSVGIGGLTLGGGVGYLVRKHGLTIDSLLGAEIVTAEGRTLQVDAGAHPDLFWAIRGGGGNFGVATSFTYRLQPVASVTGGMLVLPATTTSIASFVEAAAAAPDEVSTIANVMPAPPLPFLPADRHGQLVVLAMVLHAGPQAAAERALAPFRTVAEPIVDMVRPMPFPEIYPPDNGFHPRAVARTMFLETVDETVAAQILDICSCQVSAEPWPPCRRTRPLSRTGRAQSWQPSPRFMRDPTKLRSTRLGRHEQQTTCVKATSVRT